MNSYKHPVEVRFLRKHPSLRFLSGPGRLITAQFNARNAIFMVALCLPALFMTGLLTLPAFLFNTPQHNEYFEFAKQLDQGGGRWFAMSLSACCSFLCFAIPADQADEKN
jgi:hypothetical protein